MPYLGLKLTLDAWLYRVSAAVPYSINLALVGGGGAGGGNWGGGGGGGQVLQSITTLQPNTLYLVSVGDGAVGTSYGNPSNFNYQGKSSSFNGITAIGGGLGGNGLYGYLNGNAGASGGGASTQKATGGTPASYTGGTASYGNAGGNSTYPNVSGGGGGAGSAGGNGTATASGNGGAGIALTITGYSAGTFAGGGGGGAYTGYTAGTGTNGGGNGATGVNVSGGNATPNTGSGGGGNSGGGGGVGGNGGSGIVILSIPTANYAGDSSINGGIVDSSVWTKTISGSNTIITFLKNSIYQSGSYNTNGFTINSLVVGGGGGGSDDNATGGGSGGYVVSRSILAVSGVVFTINVGTGGQNTQWNTNNSNNNVSSEATAGQPSTLTYYQTITANGGVSGLTNGTTGGYGGGNVNPPTNDPDPNASPALIDGGIGVISSITGVGTYYAGGGGGYNNDSNSSAPSGAGLIGQGGNGGNHGNGTGSTAGANGVVILSIPTSKYSGIKTGNPVVTTDGLGNTILTYNNAGTYTA